MKNNISVMIAFFSLLSSSCQRDVQFNDFEKSLLNIYNEGDTLIFESDIGEKDTCYIIHKDVGYATWNPFAHESKYKILSGTIYYGSSRVKEDNTYFYKILTLGKSNPTTTYISLSYSDINASWNFEDFSPASWNKYELETGLYRFKIRRVSQDSTVERQTQLYFDLKHGIVKYITAKGKVWKRINIKK